MKNSKRKIAVVTGTRAEYGLLKWLMKEIQSSSVLELQCIATGSHFSPEFGNTYKNILDDKIDISYRVEMQLSNDSEVAITKSLGLAVCGFADAYSNLEPDILIVLGDRYEILAAVQAATIARIPVIHLHGGESCEGAIDESIRHAITKLSHFHFVASEKYRQRVIQLGEQPDTVFNVGPMMQDGFRNIICAKQSEIIKQINFDFSDNLFLATYHPVTLSMDSIEAHYKELFLALDALPNYRCIFTMSNTDPGGKKIFDLVNSYCELHKKRAACFVSLGCQKYYSLMNLATAVIGNSSSGLLEAPYFKVPTVNIGDRQRGRLEASSVISCGSRSEEILIALKTVSNKQWRKEKLKNIIIPYGNDKPAEKICRFLEIVDLSGNILMKKFYEYGVIGEKV